MAKRFEKQKRPKEKLTWLWVTLAALAITAVGILALYAQGTPANPASATQTAVLVEISPAQAYSKFQQGAFILDVRSQEEWDQFHVKGSLLIPLDQLSDRLSELPLDQDILVVCLSGHRSQSGTFLLLQAGFTRVFCLSGGLQAWRDAGYPLEGTAE